MVSGSLGFMFQEIRSRGNRNACGPTSNHESGKSNSWLNRKKSSYKYNVRAFALTMAANSDIRSERPEIRPGRIFDSSDGREGEVRLLMSNSQDGEDVIGERTTLPGCIWEQLYDGVAKIIDILEAEIHSVQYQKIRTDGNRDSVKHVFSYTVGVFGLLVSHAR